MIRNELDELLHRHPFEPFIIRLTRGDHYEVRDSALAALLKTAVFIAFPNSDRRVVVPLLHIAAIETANGRSSPPSRRRKG